jgi:hypothetical protein
MSTYAISATEPTDAFVHLVVPISVREYDLIIVDFIIHLNLFPAGNSSFTQLLISHPDLGILN